MPHHAHFPAGITGQGLRRLVQHSLGITRQLGAARREVNILITEPDSTSWSTL